MYRFFNPARLPLKRKGRGIFRCKRTKLFQQGSADSNSINYCYSKKTGKTGMQNEW